MNKTNLFGTLTLISILLGGCATPGGWYDDWGKCAVASGAAGAGLGALAQDDDGVAYGAVGGALVGGVLCAIMDVNEPEVVDRDSDGDGVLDSMDHCPGTAPGVAVDTMGCAIPKMMEKPKPMPMPKVIILEGVHFHHDSSVLTSESDAILDGVVDTLRMNPNTNVEVAGHTDSDGTNEYNQWLSQRRADAVMAYLVAHGINAQNLTAVGYGEEQAIADNGTREGKVTNRRVELHVK